MSTSTTTTVKLLSYDHPDAARLCEAQQREIAGVKPKGTGIVASAANIPVFVVAYKNNEAVGCGGLRPLADHGLDGQGEIKRMYVVPAQRAHQRSQGSGDSGKSVALVVLEALEQVARDRNWMVMKLDTSKAMMSARKFYEKYGYVECQHFLGTYERSEGTVCYEKFLDKR